MRGAVPLAIALALARGAAAAPPLLVEAEVLHSQGPAGTLRNAQLLVRDGRIAALGPSGSIAVPADAERLEARVVTPGLIDTHATLGLAGIHNVPADQDADEATGPVQAALRAIDAFNPREPLLDWQLAHGVTVVQTGPGEANPIGGLAGVFKTYGDRVEDMTLRFPSALIVTLGERPKATYGGRNQLPSTRMGTAAVIRKAFVEAKAYAAKQTKPRKPDAEPPARDLGQEALALALAGEIPVVATARREDDIDTALRLAGEFGLRLELADAVDAYLMRERLHRAGVPVHLGPVTGRIAALETLNLSFESAALLDAAGIPLTFQSGFEGYVPRTHVVLFEAALAASFGLGFERALELLTLEAARRLGVEDRVGSLEPGKHADLVLFDGDPFEYTSHVVATIVNGEIAYRR